MNYYTVVSRIILGFVLSLTLCLSLFHLLSLSLFSRAVNPDMILDLGPLGISGKYIWRDWVFLLNFSNSASFRNLQRSYI